MNRGAGGSNFISFHAALMRPWENVSEIRSYSFDHIKQNIL